MYTIKLRTSECNRATSNRNSKVPVFPSIFSIPFKYIISVSYSFHFQFIFPFSLQFIFFHPIFKRVHTLLSFLDKYGSHSSPQKKFHKPGIELEPSWCCDNHFADHYTNPTTITSFSISFLLIFSIHIHIQFLSIPVLNILLILNIFVSLIYFFFFLKLTV